MSLTRTALLLLALSLACVTASAEAPFIPAAPLAVGETFTIESALLGETRRINIYRPPGAPDALPVMYMPDGGLAEDFLHVAGLMQVSTANMSMRPFLLVGIENTERRRDLTGPTDDPEDKKIAARVGGSQAFRNFLRTELMPEIARRYRVTNERAIVGESLAGLFVVETLVVEPELFSTYIAIDPSLWWNRKHMLSRAAKAGQAAGKRLFLYSAGEGQMSALAREFAAAAATDGAQLKLRYEGLPQEIHQTIYHPAALKAFRSAFKPPPPNTGVRPQLP